MILGVIFSSDKKIIIGDMQAHIYEPIMTPVMLMVVRRKELVAILFLSKEPIFVILI